METLKISLICFASSAIFNTKSKQIKKDKTKKEFFDILSRTLLITAIISAFAAISS